MPAEARRRRRTGAQAGATGALIAGASATPRMVAVRPQSGYMIVMPLGAKVTVAVLLVGSVLLAYLGPPPRRRVAMRVRTGLLLAGVGGYVCAAAILAAGSLVAGVVALALASELVCAAGWLGRGDAPGSDEDGDDDDGGGGGRGPKPPPFDWDAFEQAFWRYARERERQRA